MSIRKGTFVSCLSLALTQISKKIVDVVVPSGPFDFNICDFCKIDFDTPTFTINLLADFFFCDFFFCDFDTAHFIANVGDFFFCDFAILDFDL